MQVSGNPSISQNCTRSVADRIKGISLNDIAPANNHAVETDGLLDEGGEVMRDGTVAANLNASTSWNSTTNGNADSVDKLKARARSTTASNLAASKKCPPQQQRNLTEFQRNAVRIIGQYLSQLGLSNTTEQLVEESGCRIENPLAIRVRSLIRERQWLRALDVLEKMQNILSIQVYNRTRVLLVEERIKELLIQQDSLGALKMLQRDYPSDDEFRHRREYFSTLLFKDPKEVAEMFNHRLPEEIAEMILVCLHKIMPSTVLLPPARFEDLVNQAWSYQMDRCELHLDEPAKCEPTSDFVLRDHLCSTANFPSRCSQVFHEHKSEVWCVQFSPCGRYLATGAKSSHVYVWRLENPAALELNLYRWLQMPHEVTGIACISWSHDSRILAVTAGEGNQSGVFLFNVVAGVCSTEIRPLQTESFTSVSFFGDSTHRLSCADHLGNFQYHDADNPSSGPKTFSGYRVRCLYSLKDGHTVIAADTHQRIRKYDFETQVDELLIQESYPVTYFTLDRTEEHCLVTTKTAGIRMWCLKTRTLVKTFTGSVHNEYVISSCFGGVFGDFIASGSEDEKVVIWNKRTASPVHEIRGHSGSVNSVSWNPVYHGMLASGGDDGTVRIWIPENLNSSSLSINSQ